MHRRLGGLFENGVTLLGDVAFQSMEVDPASQLSAWPSHEQHHRGWWLRLTNTEGVLQWLWGLEDKQWSPLQRHSHSAFTPWQWQGVVTGQMAGNSYQNERRNGFMSQENMTNMHNKVLPYSALCSAHCRWHNMCGQKLLHAEPCCWCENSPGETFPKKVG